MRFPFELDIDEAIRGRMPDLRLTGLVFEEVRIGMPSRKIESVRERVIAGARERVAAARDVRRIPSVAAFHQAFPEALRGARKSWLDEAFRAISRNDPFPVVNDIVDAVHLLAIHYAVPVSALDLSKVRSPLRLAMAPHGTTAKSHPGTPVDIGGLPVLVDASGPAASPFVELQRALPGRLTRDLALVVYDPAREAPIDVEELKVRATNWLGALVGARLAGTVAGAVQA